MGKDNKDVLLSLMPGHCHQQVGDHANNDSASVARTAYPSNPHPSAAKVDGYPEISLTKLVREQQMGTCGLQIKVDDGRMC